MPATIFQVQGDIIRFVRFCPWELDGPGPGTDKWVRINVPRGIGPDARSLCGHPNHTALNKIYARTLEALGRAKFERRRLSRVLSLFVQNGEEALAWLQQNDPAQRMREKDRDFEDRREKLARAAETLRRLLQGMDGGIRWAIEDIMTRRLRAFAPIPDVFREDGSPEMGIQNPFEAWNTPTSADGPLHVKDHLKFFMEVLGEAIREAEPMGLHLRQAGPIRFQTSIVGQRSLPDPFVMGLLMDAASLAQYGSGALDASYNVGAPIPTGGKPHWPLVAAYVSDVTAQAPGPEIPEITPTQARQRLTNFLKANPGVVFQGWPKRATRST